MSDQNHTTSVTSGPATTGHEITGIHKWPLIGALMVVLFTLLVVIVSVYQDRQSTKNALDILGLQETPAQSRALYFRDGKGGMVYVFDATTKKRIAKYAKGEGAFIRISMRSLARGRSLHEVEQKLPYRLEKMPSGQLLIKDPETQTSIRINAFGTTAMQSFTALLPNPSQEMGSALTTTSKEGA